MRRKLPAMRLRFGAKIKSRHVDIAHLVDLKESAPKSSIEIEAAALVGSVDEKIFLVDIAVAGILFFMDVGVRVSGSAADPALLVQHRIES